MTIWSCVPFFNEFALLDLRIAEELDVVDMLVVAEADRTHQGAPKPLHLKDNAKYRHPKIDVLLLEGRLEAGPWDEHRARSQGPRGPWRNEAAQRDAMQRECADDDVFIVADLDEINHRADIGDIAERAREHGHIRLLQQLFYYKLNLRVCDAGTGEPVTWNRAFAVSGKHLRESGRSFTELRNAGGVPVPTNGKHFSYLAEPERIAEKIRGFGHAELNEPRFTDPARIEARIRDRVDPFERGFDLQRVEIDESYPVTIRENLDAWRPFIAD